MSGKDSVSIHRFDEEGRLVTRPLAPGEQPVQITREVLFILKPLTFAWYLVHTAIVSLLEQRSLPPGSGQQEP